MDVVRGVCELTGQNLHQLEIEIRPAHWGQRKGGERKVAVHGCNLTLQNRVKGGWLTGSSNSITHLKAIASAGGAAAVKKNWYPLRRVRGPRGIRMMDSLERDVMMKLISGGVQFTYEPVVRIGLRRLIPDFRIGATYLECSRNKKVSEHARELLERFRMLRDHVEFSRGIVVTSEGLVDRYKHYLPHDIDVATVEDLLNNL